MTNARLMRDFPIILLLVCSSFLLARTLWQILSPEKIIFSHESQSNFPIQNSSSEPNVKRIINSVLFGDLQKQPLRTTSAEKPSKHVVNLSVLGIIRNADGSGYGIINYDGKIGVITQGNSLISLGNENIVLKKVRSDGIQFEKLKPNELFNVVLPSSDAPRISKKIVSSQEPKKAQNSSLTPPPLPAKSHLLLSAKNSDFSGATFNLKPLQIKGGKRVFIITSGNDRQRLQQLNIQPGDIVTHINKETADRYSLTEVIELFKQNKPVTLKLKRGVETLEFTLDTTS